MSRLSGLLMSAHFSEDQLTPWFCGSAPPEREGCYEIRERAGKDVFTARFENGRWSVFLVGKWSPWRLPFGQWEWRGLNAPADDFTAEKKARESHEKFKKVGANGKVIYHFDY